MDRNQPQLSLEIPDLEHLLSTARGVGIALLAAADIDLIARLARIPAEDLRGLFDEQTRIGTSPPRTPSRWARSWPRRSRSCTRPRRACDQSFDPHLRPSGQDRTRRARTRQRRDHAQLLARRWTEVSRGRVLRAVDGDLSTMQRLVTGSMVRPNFDGYVVEVPAASGSNTTAHVIGDPRVAVAIVGMPAQRRRRRKRRDPAVLPSASHSVLPSLAPRHLTAVATTRLIPTSSLASGSSYAAAMLGTPAQTDAILGQLAELACYLRTNGSNIWYEERLKLPWWELLHREHWEAVVESAGETPGRGKALLNARRYLFLRATAQPTRALPKQWRVLVDGYDAADLPDFHIRMSAELKTALDAYLAVWLDRAAEAVELRRKDTAPSQPFWSPPRWRGSGLAALGPELLDIDLTLLHDYLRDGVTAIRTLARVAHRSPNHVRWTLQEHPASTGVPSPRSIGTPSCRKQSRTMAKSRAPKIC